MCPVLQNYTRFVKHYRTDYSELPETRILAYLYDKHSQDLTKSEKEYIERTLPSLLYRGCVGYSRQYREQKFWRYLTVGMALHIHPRILNVTESQAGQLQGLLNNAVQELLPPHHGYRLSFERIAFNHLNHSCSAHFHFDVLPFQISDTDWKRISSDLSDVLYEVGKSQVERDFILQSTGEIKQRSVNGWLEKRRWSEDKIYGFVNKLNKVWLKIQRKVFARRLPAKEVSEDGLVYVKSKDVNAMNPLLRGTMDHAHVSRYAKKKSKFRQKVKLEFDEATGLAAVWLRDIPREYTALEAFRRFMFNPTKVRPITKGILHGRSKFAAILDEAYSAQTGFMDIMEWVTMPLPMLKRALIFTCPAILFEVILGVKKYDEMFGGRYYLVVAYLAYLHSQVDRRDRYLPISNTLMQPISTLMKFARKDQNFNRWLDHLSLTKPGKGRDAILERALCRAGILTRHRERLERRSLMKIVKQSPVLPPVVRRKPKRPMRNIVCKATALKKLLKSKKCANCSEVAKTLGISRARVTQIFQLLELTPAVIKSLTQLRILPRRVSERFLRETLRHVPRRKQMRVLRQHGGQELDKMLERLQSTNEAS